jgi:hypothetical protein
VINPSPFHAYQLAMFWNDLLAVLLTMISLQISFVDIGRTRLSPLSVNKKCPEEVYFYIKL